ncbi:hypothetical protein Tco_0610378 [Tanacetum coccineum]
MASLDHRLNSLFSIKECMSCGALYTADFCCSKGGLEDKIIVPKPPQNCATYGNPVERLYCQPCAFVRKCLNEVHLESHSLSIKTPVKIPRKVLHKLTTIVVTSVGKNCGGPHATFHCQPMNEYYYHKQNSCYDSNSFGFDQFQPPQFPINYPPQETNKEILQAQKDLMEAIQAFLKEYDHIPLNEKCMALLLAEERFLKIKQTMEEEHNQPGVMQELLLKLMDGLQILKGSQQEKKEMAA